MNRDADTLTWSALQIGQAMEAVAGISGVKPRTSQTPNGAGIAALAHGVVEKWIHDNANWYGLEAEHVDVTYDVVDQMLHQNGPALLEIPANGEPQFLVLLGDGKPVSVLAPDLSTRKISPSWVRSRLVESFEEPLSREVQPLIELAGIPPQRSPDFGACRDR